MMGQFIVVDQSTTSTEPVPVGPEAFALAQNYPNPFNPTTKISFNVPEHSQVRLTVFDTLGKEVRNLVQTGKPPGFYEVQWNGLDGSGSPVSTGVYFCRLQAGEYSETIKMVLLR